MADFSQRKSMDMPLTYFYLLEAIYSKDPAKQNSVSSHKCFTLKNKHTLHFGPCPILEPWVYPKPQQSSCLLSFLSVRMKDLICMGSPTSLTVHTVHRAETQLGS